jgi:simple sugar transport system permease protein
MVSSVPLILAGLGLGIGFRSGLFNIGAQGQVLVGAAAAAYLGFTLDLPVVAHVVVACLGAVVAGGIWAGIAGFLKARTGASEVIVTIMLNSIALYLVSYLLTTAVLRQPGSTRPITPPVGENAMMPLLLGSQFRLHAGFLVALLAALLFGALRAGSPLMQTAAGTPIDLVLVIQAVIVLLIAAPPLVRELSVIHWAATLFGYDRKKAAA